MSFGVYVHIPFCAKRCDYCAFATWTDRSHLIESYVDACRADVARADIPEATTVFFGGGTPSLIAPELLASIVTAINTTPDAEVSVECNPDTVSPHLFETYVAAGVNRISFGVQSMVPHVLASLGRTHNPENVFAGVKMAAAAGIERINVDIIYGAKGESLDDWRTTLEGVRALQPFPTHVSAYGLTVEPGTPLANDPARFPDDDDQADKYVLADDMLTDAGLRNYEISNWAAPGDECQHNMLYWRQGNYRGFGCAAHSHEDGRRWWNLRTPERYINAVNTGETTTAADEVLDEATRRFEKLELQMRTLDGMPVEAVPMEELAGFVEQRGERVFLTRKGKLMANEIATRLRA